jgi:Dimerisation domain
VPASEFTELMGIVRGYQRSQALAVAARLRIADRLAAGPQPVDQLAEQTDTHAPTLYRLLRALASIGVFTELEGHAFENNAMSELLRTDHELSIAPAAEMFCSDYEWTAWAALVAAPV